MSAGAQVKVTVPCTVYHVPKNKAGIELQGMSGVIAERVDQFEGKELSANLPLRVQFELDGKKFFAHLGEDEVEAA